jgi:hypothetical protein
MSTRGDGPRVSAAQHGRPPWTGTPGLLPASDSERGAALVQAGPGGLVWLGVPRWCSAICRGVLPVVGDDFADGGAGG